MRCCTFVSLAVTTTLLGGCGSGARARPSPYDVRGLADGGQHGGSTVLTASELQNEQRTLLDLLVLRFPAMQVAVEADCPRIIFRGRSTLVTRSDPAIYVDGLRATNTCILQELSTIDLQRVEVYPSGIPKGGYRTSATGVIVIFLRKGEELAGDAQPDTLR